MAKILEVYARAREFMAKNGNPTQWGDGYPSQELLEEDIDTNRLFVYMLNGRMQAVFAFILGEDPTYKAIEDGQWLNDTCPTAPCTGWRRQAKTRASARRWWSGVWSTARACAPTPTPTTR